MEKVGGKRTQNKNDRRRARKEKNPQKRLANWTPSSPGPPKVGRGAKKRQQKQMKKVQVAGAPSQTKIPSTDIRFAASSNTQLSLTNQLKTVTVEKALQTTDLLWVAAGFLTKALERGFLASASSNVVPFNALIYMANLMVNYAAAQAVPVTQLPYWLMCLCHAISPKSIPFENGTVAYKFLITGTTPISLTVAQMPIGYVPYGNVYNLGGPTLALVNGFPVVDTVAPTPPADGGASAFQELCQFMIQNSSNNQQKKISRLVPSTIKTPFVNDVSSYALFKNAEGTGVTGGGGGIYGMAQLEVPILHPILALVSSGQDSFIFQNPTRNFNWNTPISGDSATLGVMMSTMLSTAYLSMKRNIRAKPVDFLEFGDVMAQWVQGIAQAWCNANAKTYLSTTVEGILVSTITLQEMLLILRAVILGCFKESQAAVQGLYPFVPSSSGDNEFVPFVCSTSTCPLLGLDMHLPQPLIENIRALSARMVHHGASAHDVQWYLPVLGQYAFDTLQSSDYQVTYDGSDAPITFNIFKSGILMYEKTETSLKGEVKKTMLAETFISLIDGACGSQWLFINDPAHLKDLVAMWNDWIKDLGLDTYSITLGTLGTEKGINALASIAMTRVWAFLEGGTNKREMRKENLRERSSSSSSSSSISIVDVRTRLPRYRGLFATVYSTRTALVDLSQGEVLSVPYEQFLQTWILPIDEDEVIVGEQSTLIQRWQFIMGEPWSVPRVSAVNGTSMSSLHAVYAAKMVKGQFSEKSDWSELITEMEKSGRGGILSGLIASFVGGAVPQLAGIANTVAGMLPI